MRVIYVAGPFRGPSSWAIEQNIRRAEEIALMLWTLVPGKLAVMCPHTNTRFFQGAAPDEIWLEGDLELLRRCDAAYMTPDWARSSGACRERDLALSLGKPVFYTPEEVRAWLESQSPRS